MESMESALHLAHFWAIPVEELFHGLNTSLQGLSTIEARRRIKIYGTNELRVRRQYSLLLQIIKKILNPLVLILIFSSVVSALLGQIPELVILLVILFVSILVDSLQEHKANKAAEDLRAKVSVTATVLRDGNYIELPLGKLVPGDIVKLSVGDIVPADCRLIEEQGLMVSQSSLTGESMPSIKHQSTSLPEDTALSQRDNCVFMGTSVVAGGATALVVQTGTNTEYGDIASQLTKKRPETEFERGSREFGSLISRFTFVLVIIAFLVNSVFHHNLFEGLLFSLAIAVGMTPELLPVIISINLARGAQRMAKKSVVVKDLPSIEIFGSMDILATDKTGTLTQDEIRLEQYENAGGSEDKQVLEYGVIHSAFQTGIQNPLEKAITAHSEIPTTAYKKLGELPFDFVRKFASVAVTKDKDTLLISKGAPEALIHLSTHVRSDKKIIPLSATARKKLMDRFEALSEDGFRVLALTTKKMTSTGELTSKDEQGLTFEGFMAFFDPPKNGAHEALETLEHQGISLKILTGDNEIVTRKVCSDLGLSIAGVITGKELEDLDDAGYVEAVKSNTIFARLTPQQKERIILSLKKAGHVVGFLGDGMNDAISLRAADVGISVNNAIDAAKETADIILLRKSLRVLHEGVTEGRKTYRNIMKYILMGTSSNLGNMFSVAGASLFLPFLPMLPVQILLNDLLYDFSELVIPGDNVDAEAIAVPRKWEVSLIQKFTMVFGPISSLFDFLTFAVLLLLKVPIPLFQTVWFMESICSQTLIIFAIRTRKVPFWRSTPSLLLAISSVTVVSLALLLPLTPLRSLFEFAEPSWPLYAVVGLIVITYVLFVEVAKKIFYSRVAA